MKNPLRTIIVSGVLALMAGTSRGQAVENAAPNAQDAATSAPSMEESEVVVRVNGQEITQAQVDRAVKQLEAQGGPAMLGDEPPTMEEAQQYAVLQARERLIGQALFTQALREKSKDIADEQVEAELQKLDARIAEAGGSLDMSLEQEGKTRDILREQIRQDLAAVSLVEEIMGQQEPTEEELRTMFERYASQLARPEQIRTRQIYVPFSDEFTTSATVEQKAAAREKVEQAARRLEAGEDFGVVFKELSAAPPRASADGDFGFHGRGELPEMIDEAAWALEPGQTSDIIESPFGYHILRLEERREAAPAVFEEHRDELLQARRRQNMASNVPLAVLELRKKAKIEVLDEATGELEPVPPPAASGE